jgi:uncharacterized SAM-binding protein YcdF (DUF218 family)
MFRIVAAPFFIFVGLVLLETLFFLWILNQPSETSGHDAIVVFAGSSNRIKRAYQLAGQGVAPSLIISPAGNRSICYYEKRFGKPGNATYILEERADTTFENALHCAELINANHLKSVLLITSDYHMPRSFFLLKLATLGIDCPIGIHKLDTRSAKNTNLSYQIKRMKLTYNEMTQLWGSLIEGGLYYMGGPNEWLKTRSSGVSRWLRKHLLFDVGCPDC